MIFFKTGFLNPGITDILSWIILYCGDCPGYQSSLTATLPSTHQRPAASPVMTVKNVSGHCQVPSEGQKSPPVENH